MNADHEKQQSGQRLLVPVRAEAFVLGVEPPHLELPPRRASMLNHHVPHHSPGKTLLRL